MKINPLFDAFCKFFATLAAMVILFIIICMAVGAIK